MRAGLAFALAFAAAGSGQAQTLETSVRLGAWSGARLSDPNDRASAGGEVWVRAQAPLGENARARLEAWAGSDPLGRGQTGGDVREASLGAVTLTLGRQLFAWGRADRVNPTDVLAARDYRRLTEDDADQRLGLAAVSLAAPLAGGTLSAHWAPEFRATRLPQDFTLSGLGVRSAEPRGASRQGALRYERFGDRLDWSLTVADVSDRIPWLDLEPAAGRPRLVLRHPRLTMIGGDLASTLGAFNLRAEAATYRYRASETGASGGRAPTFYGVIGADRDFPGQWNVLAQAGVRVSEPLPGRQGLLAARNAVIQGAWRDTVTAGFVRVRKGLGQDRGALEATAAGFSAGGHYLQARATLKLADGVRLIAQAERFEGAATSYFGRLSDNSLASISVRIGF
jgi:hypothetical protein